MKSITQELEKFQKAFNSAVEPNIQVQEYKEQVAALEKLGFRKKKTYNIPLKDYFDMPQNLFNNNSLTNESPKN